MIGADYATRAVMNTRKNRMPDIFNLCVEAAATGSGRVASQMYAWGRFHRKIAVFAAFFAAFRLRKWPEIISFVRQGINRCIAAFALLAAVVLAHQRRFFAVSFADFNFK
jgi:hypothetical protein